MSLSWPKIQNYNPTRRSRTSDNNNVNQLRSQNMSPKPTVASHPPHQKLINFFSGMTAGLISVIVCNPLDIARTRLNVLKAPAHSASQGKYMHFTHAMETIWKEEGWRGFYSGFRTNVVAVPIFHSLFFLLYESLKTKIIDEGYSHETAYLSGTMIAGSLCNIVTNPIWVVRTRLMAQYLHHESNHYKTTAPFSIIRQMYQEEGLHSLFKGLVPSLFSVLNAMVYFSCYQNLKELLGPDLSVGKIFFSSTLSKIVATTCAYPVVVVRTVMFDFRGKEKSHLTNIVKHIYHRNGVVGFYAGLKPDLIRLIPSNAIVFIVYEELRQFFQIPT